MNKLFSKNSLYVTLIISIIFIVTVVISLYTAHTYAVTKERLVENIKHNSKQTMDALKKNIAKLIESYSINEYNLLLQNELEKRDILAIIVEDYKMSEIMAQQVYVSGKIKDSHNNTITDFNPNNME